MLNKLLSIQHLIGATPLHQLESDNLQLFVKLEYSNFSGSIKARAAFNILSQAIKQKKIRPGSLVIESSSGNMAIALASICGKIGLEFVPVIDPNINKANENILNLLSTRVIKITELDETGGYLLNRIRKVKEILQECPNAYWTAQYENPENYLGYQHTLGQEICDQFDRLDYAFISVSSGGTITGVSRRLKEKFKKIKIIAVDVEGSVIFGQKPQKRYISGLGASMKPIILAEAEIDEVVHVSQLNIIKGCKQLLREQMVFAGASSGAAYYALQQYFRVNDSVQNPHVLFLCADRGDSYLDTIYNEEWEQYLASKVNPDSVLV